MSTDKLIKDLKEKYGRSMPDVNEIGNIKRLVLSSPKMNYIFGGGYPLSRIIELHGSPSAGKTVLASYIGGEIQNRKDKDGPKGVLFIDMEYSFDPKYARVAGLSTEKNFFFVQPQHGEEAFTIMEDLIKSGDIGLIIYDSVTATPTVSQMTDDYGKACVSPNTEIEFRVID